MHTLYTKNINFKKIKKPASEIECFHSVHYFYAIQIDNIISHDEKNIKHYMNIAVHSKVLHC